ncbi:MAG: hypothetical protein ACTSQS_13385 [Promethearchaeota archaeon]
MNLMKSKRNYIKKINIFFLFLIFSSIIFTWMPGLNLNNLSANEEDNNSKFIINNSPKVSKKPDPSTEIDGTFFDRIGKTFSNVSIKNKDNQIYRTEPTLNDPPTLYLSDWNLTYASLHFENLTAVNYTWSLEPEGEQFMYGSDEYPIYIYQKFSVDISQYVNNVSIFIQDINDQYNYTEENSWELSILNCSNDKYGTPDTVLGTVQKVHPFVFAAHWETFDFKNSINGPVFLNISKTNYTINKDGKKKYWFAFRIKVPPEDVGPKFIYFNIDNEQNPNDIGQGETFVEKKDMYYENYTINYLTQINPLVNGTILKGNLQSTKYWDEDRVVLETDTDNMTIDLLMSNIKNLTIALLNDLKVSLAAVKNYANINPNEWAKNHFIYIYSMNLSIVSNVSDVSKVKTATLLLRNFSESSLTSKWTWINLTKHLDMDILNENEIQVSTIITDADTKRRVLNAMNTTNDINELLFKLKYNGNDSGKYNASINKFIFTIGELRIYEDPMPYDPLLIKRVSACEYKIQNGTESFWPSQDLSYAEINENKYFRAQADTNNLSIEFKFNLLPNIDPSFWNVSMLDWMILYPNPIVPIMYLRLAQNVSITHQNNLSIAMFEIYKGPKNYSFLSAEQNAKLWLPISDSKDLAISNENQMVVPLGLNITWIILQFANTSDQNSIRLRLRYVGNETQNFQKFNVSIDEIGFDIYIQNAISSDITSKIGFGLNSKSLTPSDINLTLNIDGKHYSIQNKTPREGFWKGNISNGIPYQGNYVLNITSLWYGIKFDLIGNYTLYHSHSFSWNYRVKGADNNIFWNVSTHLENEDFGSNLGEVIKYSKGFQIYVPVSWKMMKVFNCTGLPPDHGISSGSWSWDIKISNPFKIISIYNISDGFWKVLMNSSKINMNLSYSYTSEVKIDKIMNIQAIISGYIGGKMKFEVYDENKIQIYSDDKRLNETINENNATFTWDIFETTKVAGNYTLKISWIMLTKNSAYVALETQQISVLKYGTKLELLDTDSFQNETIYGQKITIRGKLIDSDSGDGIEGEEVIVQIKSEEDIIDEISDRTNKDGIIQVEYTIPDNTEWIEIKLKYDGEGQYYESAESAQAIKITTVSQGQYILNRIIEYLPYIIIVLAAITAVTLIQKHRIKKRRAFWASEAMILDDLLKINYLMIIHKNVGVAIYSQQIGMTELDSDLIGGFIHATAQFRKEIKKDIKESKEGKIFQLDYQDFIILITDANFIRVALILEGTPSEQLKESLWAFTNEFEKEFWPYLENFSGDIQPFRAAEDMIKIYFNTDLMYPLQLARHWEVLKLDPLERALCEVAKEMQKERKFFFVSSLLSYGLAGRKESRDHIISAILELKRKGIIVPIEFTEEN